MGVGSDDVEYHLAAMGFRDGFAVPVDARALMDERRLLDRLARSGALAAADDLCARLDAGEDVGEVLSLDAVEARLTKYCGE